MKDMIGNLVEAGDEIVYSWILNSNPKLALAKVVSTTENSIQVQDIKEGLFFDRYQETGIILNEYGSNIAIVKKWFQ